MNLIWSSIVNMTQPRNITYYFGAGASYQAMPIQNELGQQMVLMASDLINKGGHVLNQQEIVAARSSRKNDSSSPSPYIMLAVDLAYFGYKALEYGSVDTYARRLSFIKDKRELQRLKNVISIFFSLWHIGYGKTVYQNLTTHGSIDGLNPDAPRSYSKIDSRYIRLVASILKSNSQDTGVTIPTNHNFITWNYDLQLERSVMLFHEKVNPEDWGDALKKIGVTDDFDKYRQYHEREYQITHLNGYHGFYETNQPIEFLTRFFETISTTGEVSTDHIIGILNANGNFVNPDLNSTIRYENNISYAWEITDTSQSGTAESGNSQVESSIKRVQMAKDIIAQTDDLVIVGYSFPNFNKEIDRGILSQFKSGPGKQIIYQGLENITPRIGTYFNELKNEIKYEATVDEFILPESYI